MSPCEALGRSGGALRGPVSAWRLFRLDGDRLLPPFQAWYWPDTLTEADTWKAKGNVGRCLSEQHRVPAEGCTCGLYGVRLLPELLAQARAMSFAGSDRSVLEDCDVLARVVLHGLILPAPTSEGPVTADPPSAVRGSVGSIAELFLRPGSDPAALSGRYGVPVTVCEAWPDDADPERMLLRLVGGEWARLPQQTLLGLARSAASAAANDVTRADLASVLFRANGASTWTGARDLVDLSIRCFAPETQHFPDVHVHGQPVTVAEDVVRRLLRMPGPML